MWRCRPRLLLRANRSVHTSTHPALSAKLASTIAHHWLPSEPKGLYRLKVRHYLFLIKRRVSEAAYNHLAFRGPCLAKNCRLGSVPKDSTHGKRNEAAERLAFVHTQRLVQVVLQHENTPVVVLLGLMHPRQRSRAASTTEHNRARAESRPKAAFCLGNRIGSTFAGQPLGVDTNFSLEMVLYCGGKCGSQRKFLTQHNPNLFKYRPTLPHCPTKIFPHTTA